MRSLSYLRLLLVSINIEGEKVEERKRKNTARILTTRRFRNENESYDGMEKDLSSCVDFFSIRCSTRTYSLQRCRFSTRTIPLCASSCRQLSSRFIRGHVLPPGIFYRNLNLPCKPALHTQGTVRSNIRPIFAYREKYIYKR